MLQLSFGNLSIAYYKVTEYPKDVDFSEESNSTRASKEISDGEDDQP